MPPLDWKKAEAKLNRIINRCSKIDVYVVINVVAPLRLRLHNGERSIRLYNRIMSLRFADAASGSSSSDSGEQHTLREHQPDNKEKQLASRVVLLE